MTITPHPIVLTAAGEQRRAEIQAQVDIERLAQRATSHDIARHTRLVGPSLRLLGGLLPLVLTVARPH